MSMRVLFLDIDGVLNSTRTYIATGGYPMELTDTAAFDWTAIKLLQRLCDSSGVQIVLSSAWRKLNTAEQVAEAFGLPVIDVTPCLDGKRGEEIKAWLDVHTVEAFAILDDDADMLPWQQSRFVQTNAHEGMTWANFVKVCELLGESAFAGSARDRDWMRQK